MAEFYRGDNTQVKARIARVLWAPTTGPAPTQLADVIDLSTYEPNATYLWEDLGLTTEPLTLPHTIDASGFVTQQRGEIRKTPQETRFLGRTTLGEVTIANRKKFMEGDTVSQPTANENRMYLAKPKALTNFRMAFLNLDEDSGLIDGIIFLKAQITGAAGEQTWARGAASTLPIEVEAYPNDDGIVTSDTGAAVVRIDLEQVTP
jgi:hypothetical protein